MGRKWGRAREIQRGIVAGNVWNRFKTVSQHQTIEGRCFVFNLKSLVAVRKLSQGCTASHSRAEFSDRRLGRPHDPVPATAPMCWPSGAPQLADSGSSGDATAKACSAGRW